MILAIDTPSTFLVCWSITREQLFNTYTLGFIPILSSLILGTIMYFVSGALKLSRKSKGTIIIASMISNNGMTLGGFLCLLLLGVEGLKYSQIYNIFLFFYFFTVLFSIGRMFSGTSKPGFASNFRKAITDPYTVLPVAAIAVGILLSIKRIAFPSFLEIPRTVLVYIAVAGYSISIGLGLKLGGIRRDMKAIGIMAGFKFMLAPLAGIALAFLFGFSHTSNPTAFSVILIQSCMPVGLYSVIISKLYDLDETLAVNLWLLTTLGVSVLVPVLRAIVL